MSCIAETCSRIVVASMCVIHCGPVRNSLDQHGDVRRLPWLSVGERGPLLACPHPLRSHLSWANINTGATWVWLRRNAAGGDSPRVSRITFSTAAHEGRRTGTRFTIHASNQATAQATAHTTAHATARATAHATTPATTYAPGQVPVPRMQWRRDGSSQFEALFPQTAEESERLPVCSISTLSALFPWTRSGGSPTLPRYSAHNPNVMAILRRIARTVCLCVEVWEHAPSDDADPRVTGAPANDYTFDLGNFSQHTAVIHPTVISIVNTMGWMFGVLHIEPPCSVAAAIYLHRLVAKGVRVTAANCEPILVAALLLASKMWDDMSTLNADFTRALPHYNIVGINRLERLFIGRISWNCNVTRAEYNRYYFETTTARDVAIRTISPVDVKDGTAGGAKGIAGTTELAASEGRGR